MQFANDYGWLEHQIDSFGTIAGAKPLPFDRDRSRTKKFHKTFKPGHGWRYELGRWVKGTI